MTNNLFVDISFKQHNRAGGRICGDSFVHKRIHGDNRTVIVLSDGMGHGVKANVLSTLTASMVVNFAAAKEDICRIAGMVLNNLPVCSVRKISYSTFTIVDINHKTQEVTIAEHDNPQSLVFRGAEPLATEWDCLVINENENRLQTILTTKFKAAEGDRIVIMSDGITQSGLGSEKYPFGWGHKNAAGFIAKALGENLEIRSEDIASALSRNAIANDCGAPKDDMSCAVIHIHKPERLLLASCPPESRDLSKRYAERLMSFEGKKILCGYPVSEIVAKELGTNISKDESSEDAEVPPLWHIEGLDMVTEGIITINKVYDLLSSKEDVSSGKGAAYQICRMLLASDEIHFMLGTKRGAQNSAYMHDEFELRRKVLKRTGELLEKEYFKQVNVFYI